MTSLSVLCSQDTPPNPNDLTAINIPPPPSESPPPISPGDRAFGPSPVVLSDTNHHGNRWPPTSSPHSQSNTPALRVEVATPDDSYNRTWGAVDSFDDFDDEYV